MTECRSCRSNNHAHCLLGNCTCELCVNHRRVLTASIQLSKREDEILELAFIIQDPSSQAAVILARELLLLVRDRDDATAVALTSEVRALQMKFRRLPSHVQKS